MQAKNESPDRSSVQSRDSSFLFIVAKHPPGYLLPLSCLSSHLLMRWQTTPAVTVTRNVKNNSMQNTASRCRVQVGQHKYYNISIDNLLSLWTLKPFLLLLFHHRADLHVRCRCLFLPQMHKKDLTGSNLLPVDPCLFVLLCIHLFSSGYPALLLSPKIVTG